ncbi:AI-2E family transporter [Halosquirtibacter xylanolyticus]|uniref:AI-2E family transporter n=1 Tax=Halosquirtibacter xylanolyticus TaxID=3374599 RepID=UPI003749058F|nr:AI-2E family transporter [Prolixibacteraceae bacterium]
MNQRTRNILIGIGFIFLALLLWYFSDIVIYILIASVLSVLGRPIKNLLEKIHIRKWRMGDNLSSALTLIALWIVIIGFFSFLIPMFASEAKELSNVNVHSVVAYIKDAAEQLTTNYPFIKLPSLDEQSLVEMAKGELSQAFDLSKMTNIFSSVFGTLGSLLILSFSVSFILFFFLRDENMFTDGIMLFVPSEYESKVRNILHSTSSLLKRYVIGIILEILGIMIFDTIGFTVIGLGFSHAVVVATFAGLMNVVPYVGPWIGAIFGVLVAIATNVQSPFMEVTLPLIGLVLLVAALSQIADNIVFQPLIYSNSVKAQPLEIFLVILMAGSVAGVPGMILAIPGYTVIRVVLREFFYGFSFVRKLTQGMDIADD